MQVNVKKTEGIRCGKLKREPHVISTDVKSDLIKWVKEGEWVRLLGIPFWEKYDEDQFHESLYFNPFPAPRNGPGSRGSRPALMRLSDLGAILRHCTPSFL